MALGPRARVLLLAALVFAGVAALVWYLSYGYWSQPVTPLRPPANATEALTPSATPTPQPTPTPQLMRRPPRPRRRRRRLRRSRFYSRRRRAATPARRSPRCVFCSRFRA